MKTAKIIVITAIAVYVLMLVFAGPCNEPTEPANKAIQQGDKELRDSLTTYKRFNDSAVRVIIVQDSVIGELKAKVHAKETDLQSSKSTALQLRNELREWRTLDTLVSYRKIDSLLVETDNLTYLLDQYITAYNSLSDAVAKQDSTKDALLEQRAQLIAQMKTQYDKVYTGYNDLFNSNKDLKKSLKREKVKTKVAVVLAVVAGVLSIFK